jgi:IS605 OrfB family transposase
MYRVKGWRVVPIQGYVSAQRSPNRTNNSSLYPVFPHSILNSSELVASENVDPSVAELKVIYEDIPEELTPSSDEILKAFERFKNNKPKYEDIAYDAIIAELAKMRGIEFYTTTLKKRNLLKAERRLKKLQRDYSRTWKGSCGREQARQRLARQHKKRCNQQRDLQHQLSRTLIARYGVIGLEDLQIKGMLQNHHLAKPIQDAGWVELVRQLEDKGQGYGKPVERINRWMASSKTCSNCLRERAELSLRIREWQCPACGAVHDRDVNAARNIARIGLGQMEKVGREPPEPKTPVEWVWPTSKPEAQAL